MTDPTVRVFPDEIRKMAGDEWARHVLAGYGGTIGRTAAQNAPKRTGEGAASIAAVTAMEAGSWTVRVSWDVLHRYMIYPDLGTKYIDGQHFLEEALLKYGTGVTT